MCINLCSAWFANFLAQEPTTGFHVLPSHTQDTGNPRRMCVLCMVFHKLLWYWSKYVRDGSPSSWFGLKKKKREPVCGRSSTFQYIRCIRGHFYSRRETVARNLRHEPGHKSWPKYGTRYSQSDSECDVSVLALQIGTI